MEKDTAIALGINFAVVCGLFGWIYSYGPYPDHILNAKVDEPTVEVVANKSFSAVKDLQIIVKPAGTGVEAAALVSTDVGGADIKVFESTGTSVNLRSGPGTNNRPVAVVSTGMEFQKLEKSGRWIKVRRFADGLEGWIFDKYLKAAG